MTQAAGIVGEFFALKEETDAELLAMQCGDFYEFFADDAETVASELDLKVSQKSSHGSTYPMAGVPVDDLTPYLSALIERGYRVAVADQYETEDGHEREITRVVTPGTHLRPTDDEAQYLAAVVRNGDSDNTTYGLALADVTTGTFRLAERAGSDARAAILTELYKVDPAEVLPGPTVRTDDEFLVALRERTDASLSLHDTEAFAPGRARHRLREQFGDETLDSVGVADDDVAIRAAGAVLAYVAETGAGVLASMTRLQSLEDDAYVELDATTQRNLELTETMHGDSEGALLETMDTTVTSAGGRRLADWLQRPRRDREEIERRQTAVAALAEAAMARDRLRETLGDAYDLERLATRAASGSADARDLRATAATLEILETVADIIAETETLATSPLSAVIDRPDRREVGDLAATIEEALVEDPPGTITQGGLIRRGYDDTLDEIVSDHEAALSWIESLPEREQRRHDITHLSVDRNKTDGYYIQVGQSETDKVPDAYEQIKTLKNSERYTIPELEEREREILRLEERRHEMEQALFEALRDQVAEHAELLQTTGRALAEVDALASLASHAVRNDWSRPAIREDRRLAVEAGRHPVVEQTTEFVPNDLRLDEDRQFLIVTGPNMSGKSTYLRQAALIVLLSHVGSFVPAQSAEVGIVDGIYTRVGALDELAQGRSTFMVEMQELSNILHSASDESLVILDEVGRGTATYDGISIAWAATEYLHNEVRAKTLFATHYHELTTLAEHLERVSNVHVAADERDGEVTFLRTVREGPTDRSYGIHVADLAGVPKPVVERSRDILQKLRDEKAIEAKGAGGEAVQTVFDLGSGEFRPASGQPHTDEAPADREATATADGGAHDTDQLLADAYGPEAPAVFAELAEIDVEETPPVELLATVREWQRRLDWE